MSEVNRDAFDAIVAFVDDLWSVYGEPKKATPLALYRRLLEHIKKDTDENAKVGIGKCIDGFVTFITTNEKYLSGSEEEFDKLPVGVCVYYSKNAFLEVGKFYGSATDGNKAVIRSHILAILALIRPSEEALKAFEAAAVVADDPIYGRMGLDKNTTEGKFVGGIMQKAKKVMGEGPQDDPAAAVMNLFSSGIIGDMVTGIKTGTEEGTMDMTTLLSSMQGALSSIMPKKMGGDKKSEESAEGGEGEDE